MRIPQRVALAALALATGSFCAACGGSSGPAKDPSAHSTPTTGIDPLTGRSAVEKVRGGFTFTEGPVWIASRGVLLFSDIPADTIDELQPPASVTVFRTPTGRSNGLGLDPQGRLIASEGDNRRVSRTLADGTVVTVADRWQGKRLNSPNDNITRSDGTIYFTDPPYGVPAGQARELDFQGVFRVDPAGTLHLESSDMNRPNGVALSPDEKTLYVDDTADGLVRKFPVRPDGSLGPPTLFVPSTGGGGDGMAVDDAGNVYVATDAGVQVYKPNGVTWGTIAVPEVPSNCTFGGPDRKTLYITAKTSLYRVALTIPGRP
ncbi:SMP-30/gluconolactonase/LRE family protein [Mycobacterium sp.]|uniref:SMP-30/gluconolactonase/LRE family protein n=1 Tax=Mycobacterium sp. TaxID=1785 RepID=UPI00262FEF84|nr:SMP-30/gluconolactonase/LRE family protein [Mycobacterium sp.]